MNDPISSLRLMRVLRATSLTEGGSYLLLLGVAMPLKYLWDWPLAVKYVGWAHGVLFISLGTLVLASMMRASLPFRTAFWVGVASLLPAGPFFADRLLRHHEKLLSPSSAADDTTGADV